MSTHKIKCPECGQDLFNDPSKHTVSVGLIHCGNRTDKPDERCTFCVDCGRRIGWDGHPYTNCGKEKRA